MMKHKVLRYSILFLLFLFCPFAVFAGTDGNSFIHYKLPDEMEERSGLYGEITSAVKTGDYDIVLQQKGLNELSDEGLEDYARILISYKPLSDPFLAVSVTRRDESFLDEFDDMRSEFCQDYDFYKELYDSKYVTIDGYPALCFSYLRYSIPRGNSDVKVSTYNIIVGDYEYTMTMSYRVSAEFKWKRVFADFVKSISFPENIEKRSLPERKNVSFSLQNVPSSSVHFLWMREPKWQQERQGTKTIASFMDSYEAPDGEYTIRLNVSREPLEQKYLTPYLRKVLLQEFRSEFKRQLEKTFKELNLTMTEQELDSRHFMVEYTFSVGHVSGYEKVYGTIEDGYVILVYFESVGDAKEVIEVKDSIGKNG